VVGELYRANPIQNYDVGALRAITETGVEVLFYSAHPVASLVGPLASYEFTGGTVTIDETQRGAEFTAHFADGTTKTYGAPSAEQANKFLQCVEAVHSGAPVACDARAASAQCLAMNGLQDSASEIVPLPPALLKQMGEPGDLLTYLPGLENDLRQCWERGVLPAELGSLPWTRAGRQVDLRHYRHFPGGQP
jgi:hypothetical protein